MALSGSGLDSSGIPATFDSLGAECDLGRMSLVTSLRGRTGCVEQLRKNLRDLENGAVLLRCHVPSKRGERRGIEHLLHSFRHIFKTLQYDAYPLLFHPLRVVPLLREFPGVALNEDRQLADHAFRIAARPGPADPEISCTHQPTHLFRKAHNMHRQLTLA